MPCWFVDTKEDIKRVLLSRVVVKANFTWKKQNKWSRMLLRHLGRRAEVMERVFEANSPCAASRLRPKKCVRVSCSKNMRMYLLCSLPLFETAGRATLCSNLRKVSIFCASLVRMHTGCTRRLHSRYCYRYPAISQDRCMSSP